jgi:hypothetical protein
MAIAAATPLDLLGSSFVALADDVPDALSVEWQRKKPCEKLSEDEHIRVARCTFPPGAMHVCHSHPAHLAYVLSGRPRAGPGRPGYAEGRGRYWRYVRSATDVMASVYQCRRNDGAIPDH